MSASSKAIINVSILSHIMKVATLGLMFVGLLYLVGFAYGDTLHDAAHDVRHNATFPCH